MVNQGKTQCQVLFVILKGYFQENRDGFTIKINLFKFKRFKDGRYIYKNTRSSNLNSVPNFKNESVYNGANNTRPTSLEIGNQD